MRAPCAALSLAACLYWLFTTARSGDKGPEQNRSHFPWLAAMFVIACALRLVLYPHHAGQMNDDMYVAQSARAMLDPSFSPINNFHPPAGWPFIASLAFWVTGPNQYTLFYLNSIFGCLSVIAAFYLGYGLTGRTAPGLAAAGLLAIHPLHTMWSVCGAGLVPSLFFILISLASLFWFFRLHHAHYIFLSLFSASMAAQINAVNLIALLMVPLLIFLLCKELFDAKKVLFHMIAPTALAVPAALHELSARVMSLPPHSAARAIGDKGGLAALAIENISREISSVAQRSDFSLLLIALAAAGVAMGVKKYGRTISVLVGLFAFCFAVLSFVTLEDVFRNRFYLYPDLCLLMISCFLIQALIDNSPKLKLPALALCITVSAAFSVPRHTTNLNPVNPYFQYGKSMTAAIERISEDLPADAVLILEDPAPFQAVTRINSISPEIALSRAQDLMGHGNVYFFADISTRGMNPVFYDIFSLELEFAIPFGFEQPRLPESGLYKVTAINTSVLTAPQPPPQPAY
jgi:hypothetical protein